MNDKLTAIMDVFAGLSHGEQVELFLSIKEGLLKNRQIRREEHQKMAEVQKDNINALVEGDNIIINGHSTVAKASA